MMRDAGATRLLVKTLSANDNSKNQIYFGGDFGVVNIIPSGTPMAVTSGAAATPIFKAPVQLAWLRSDGPPAPAPFAQLILYPQYPEVRLSGFLRAAEWAPSEVMTQRIPGRALLLGVTPAGLLVAHAAMPDSKVATELRETAAHESIGIFQRYALNITEATGSSRELLLRELCRISGKGWIPGWTLLPDGSSRPCNATNCVGVTLESELGILANARSEPDFLGWEVKAHTVRKLSGDAGGALTLMTPEPTGGVYREEGVVEFVRRYGYDDKRGRAGRRNFGGIHRVGRVCAATGLMLLLDGYDTAAQKLTRADGQLALTDTKGIVAAAWTFSDLLMHWSRKHANTAFVPAIRRQMMSSEYRFGERILLASGSDYLQLLRAFAVGVAYYDPGIKVETVLGSPTAKRRSQFRVRRAHVGRLYKDTGRYDACRASETNGEQHR